MYDYVAELLLNFIAGVSAKLPAYTAFPLLPAGLISTRNPLRLRLSFQQQYRS